jgi:hypothetical protein
MDQFAVNTLGTVATAYSVDIAHTPGTEHPNMYPDTGRTVPEDRWHVVQKERKLQSPRQRLS